MTSPALAPGVWGVVATPFSSSDLAVDLASLSRLVRHYEGIGVAGLTVLGVFGEAAQLSVAERRAVLEGVAGAVALPMVVGVTALAAAPAVDEIQLAQQVAGDRLAAVMVQVNSPDPTVLSHHLKRLNGATGAAVVVQDYPLVSGVRISAPTLASAISELDFIAAVKAESPPTPPSIAALVRLLDVPVFGGLGGLGLLDELAAGASGAMTGFSFPEGLLACVEGFRTGGYAAARAAYLPYLPLVNFEQQVSIALAIRKKCLHERGLIAEAGVRAPAARLPDALLEQLRNHVRAVPQHEVVAASGGAGG